MGVLKEHHTRFRQELYLWVHLRRNFLQQIVKESDLFEVNTSFGIQKKKKKVLTDVYVQA